MLNPSTHVAPGVEGAVRDVSFSDRGQAVVECEKYFCFEGRIAQLTWIQRPTGPIRRLRTPVESDAELALAHDSEAVDTKLSASAYLACGFTDVEHSLESHSERSKDAPLDADAVDYLRRSRAAEDVDERPEIAHRERVDQVGMRPGGYLKEAEGSEVSRSLDADPDNVRQPDSLSGCAQRCGSVDPLDIVTCRGRRTRGGALGEVDCHGAGGFNVRESNTVRSGSDANTVDLHASKEAQRSGVIEEALRE